MIPLLVLLLFVSGAATVEGEIHGVFMGQSIQAAVDSASRGDTVLIHDGTYNESIVLYGKTLTVGSLFMLDGDTTHIRATTVSGTTLRPDTASAFVYAYGEGMDGVLVGLSVSGQGTWQTRSQRIAGGAIHVNSAAVRIHHCRITDSWAVEGGGLHVWGDAWVTTAFAEIRDCEFYNCHADYRGGGVHALQCSLEVDRTSFISDSCTLFTGGMHISLSRALVEFCTFYSCYGRHGGLLYSGSAGTISNCVFDGNGGPTEDFATAHLEVSESSTEVYSNIFRNNSTGTYSLFLSWGPVPHRFYGNVIEGNVTTLSTGTLMTANSTTGDVAYNLIRSNRNVHGGALYALGGSRVHVHHNWFEDNISDDPDAGSVVVVTGLAEPTVDSNVVMNNLGQTMTARYNQIQIDARNNWWGHPSGPYHPTLNPFGQGDTLLSDSVLFIPWLTEPPDTSVPPGYLSVRTRPELSKTWELLGTAPNPFNSSIRIVLAGFAGSDFEITLHNLLGQVVEVIHRGPLTGGQITYQAPPALASGVYFLRASDHIAVQSRKIILMK